MRFIYFETFAVKVPPKEIISGILKITVFEKNKKSAKWNAEPQFDTNLDPRFHWVRCLAVVSSNFNNSFGGIYSVC